MNHEIKKKIENFIDDAIKNNDFAILDILFNFYYSLEMCLPDYFYNKEDFWKKFKICTRRNIEKKYSLNPKEKIKYFENFLVQNLAETFYSEKTVLNTINFVAEIYRDKVFKIFIENINNKIKNLSDMEKELIAFVLDYVKNFMDENTEDDFIFETWRETNTNKEPLFEHIFNLTYIFNKLFNKNLKEYEVYKIGSEGQIRWMEPTKIYFFSELGDTIVKTGLGYWSVFVRSHKFRIILIIPRILYEGIKDERGNLPIIEDFERKVEEIKKEKEVKELIWGKLGEEEEKVKEKDIREFIASHLEIIEEGLSLIKQEYSTPVGYIDILCKNKDGNFVVIEIKREEDTDKVVGQIQRYMSWIKENMAEKEGKEVKGVIVVKEKDKKLEHSVKGSGFKIEIKEFKDIPPVENIKLL